MDPTTAALEKEHEAVSVVDESRAIPSMTWQEMPLVCLTL